MTNIDYLYNPAAAKPHFEKNYFSNKKLGFRIIENGMILSHNYTGDDGKRGGLGYGGIVDSNGEWLKESFIHYGTGGKYTPPPRIN